MDALSVLLQNVHLFETKYYRLNGTGNWSFSIDREDAIVFYVVLSGSFCIDVGDEIRQAKAGDTIMLSSSTHHRSYALNHNGNEAKPLNSKMSFDEFKLNSDGMLTVVVQDHKTNEVLMVAYMTKEAYDKTIETGIMTYYSRSRDELWIKGETSGHYQYVKDLYIDCDRDTLLAKVKQIGAACHTGNYSCFYTDLLEKED